MSASNTVGAPGSRAEGRHSEKTNEAAVIFWASWALCGSCASMAMQAKAFLSQKVTFGAEGHDESDLLLNLYHSQER